VELLIAIALGTTIVGLFAGYLIAQRTAPSQQSQKQLQSHLQDLQQQQENYQHEVTEHFVETANLLNQLTNSYTDVHNHLAKGAQLLAGESASNSLQALPEAKDLSKGKKLDESDIRAPLDYAPKRAPNAPGMLNEEFGLDKARKKADLEASTIIENHK
jgi:hypothetical protein